VLVGSDNLCVMPSPISFTNAIASKLAGLPAYLAMGAKSGPLPPIRVPVSREALIAAGEPVDKQMYPGDEGYHMAEQKAGHGKQEGQFNWDKWNEMMVQEKDYSGNMQWVPRPVVEPGVASAGARLKLALGQLAAAKE
jgi:hypothetical protein